MAHTGDVFVVVTPPDGGLEAPGSLAVVSETDNDGRLLERSSITAAAIAARAADPGDVFATARWAWADTREAYPPLAAAGLHPARAHDLRLARAILSLRDDTPLPPGRRAVAASRVPTGTLFDAFETPERTADEAGDQDSRADADVGELAAQLTAIGGSANPPRLRLLLAAESCGALVAEEMRNAGVPWRVDVHDRLLTAALGPRPAPGLRPAELERLAADIRAGLGAPLLNPDSPQDVLRALRGAGLPVASTRSWELKEIDHPVIAPLLAYKKLARLWTANGWTWLDTWVADGRFRPVYVVGGVVTGRWASDGGGALQIPQQVRGAVVADEGRVLVVADAAQLEPRILAAMSADGAMAEAARGADLYAALVDRGVVDTRAHAKTAMLGALYGATSGRSASLLPGLRRAYPAAMGLVDDAATRGEAGEQVETWLGRRSPLPTAEHRRALAEAASDAGTPAERADARRRRRDWGRFTRNFVCQGTAAEWALVWIAETRRRLAALGTPDDRPELVFFLHDELVVHTPEGQADAVADALRDAAEAAGRLLFGAGTVDFRLSVATVAAYGDAKG